jgi:hypothetical protein
VPNSPHIPRLVRILALVLLASAPSRAVPAAIAAVPAGLVPLQAAVTTVERRIATGTDDAEESATGSMYLDSSDLELVYDGSNQKVGLRYTNVSIPRGATITLAYVQFEADELQSEATNLLIQGEAADHPLSFSSTNKVSTRVRTLAGASWAPVAWTLVGEAGVSERTPDLSGVVQEIVNRTGWASGNEMAFILTGTGHRTARAYEGVAAGAALLHVEFTSSAPLPNQAPSVDAGPDQSIKLPADAGLDGTVSDDGLPNPPAALTTQWSVASGPGPVTFQNASAVDTRASFTTAGTYLLRLSANDGALVATDSVRVTVQSGAVADEVHWTITGPTSVTFDWRGAGSALRYGSTPTLGQAVTPAAPSPLPFSSSGPFWEARLTGLQPSTVYYYSIGTDPVHTFRTAPARGSSGFTVAVEGDIGDSGTYPEVASVQSLIAGVAPAFVLALGDLTYGNSNGLPVVDAHFNDVMAWSRDAAYMPVWGNHEWESPEIDDLRNYKGRFELPNPRSSPGSPAVSCCGEDWSWFDYGNVRLITYPEPWTSATWADWYTQAGSLMDQAQADPAIRFIVTLGHRPAYSSGIHPGDPDLQGYLDALGDAHAKYVLNLNGHSHDYERSAPLHGVVHLTVGAGGASLEPDSACVWRECTPPAWSAFRAMRLGPAVLRFTDTGIDGQFLCGPPSVGVNDLACTVGSVADHFVIGTPSPWNTIERRIAAASDDAEESANGKLSRDTGDLELVYDGGLQKVGLRYTNVAIPAGATITRAWIQFEADEQQSELTSLLVQGEAADHPVTYSQSNRVSTRLRTLAAAPWTPAAWTIVGEAGTDQRTPDLSAVVQEIVNRPGWASGSEMAFVITGTGHRTARSYEGRAAGAPLLHVEFASGAAHIGQAALAAAPAGDAPRLELALHGVSPNPSRGTLSVEFSLADAQPALLEVLDVTGRRVAAREVGALGPGRHQLDLRGGLRPGVYLVRLAQGSRARVTKAVVTL